MARTARSRSVARITAACLAVAVLTGACASAKPQSPLAAVIVAGEVPKKPTVKLSKSPITLTKSELRVLKSGSGEKISTGQRVTVDYSLINGKDGKEAETSFGNPPANFIVDPRLLMPGLAEGLIGQTVGSRVLIGIPPGEGFGGGAGNPSMGFAKDDSLIFVVDIKATKTTLKKAEGEPVKPAAGLPTVKDNGEEQPTVTMPDAKPKSSTVVQKLIEGKGSTTKTGQTVIAKYTGLIYGSGKVFDSSYTSGQPLVGKIGVKGLIPGFDKGLTGQKVGSRVLIVIPPADGYGKAGNPQAGIKGTDNLVFVVDILDAY